MVLGGVGGEWEGACEVLEDGRSGLATKLLGTNGVEGGAGIGYGLATTRLLG